MLCFSPEFMRKNQKPNQVNDPWYIPVIPTGKPEFGAPNCPVRALCYYHRYLTEHPELRKNRRCLFVPIKDNNAGKELSASTIVDSHATIQDSKNLSGFVKAHEVSISYDSYLGCFFGELSGLLPSLKKRGGVRSSPG